MPDSLVGVGWGGDTGFCRHHPHPPSPSAANQTNGKQGGERWAEAGDDPPSHSSWHCDPSSLGRNADTKSH